MLRLAMLYALVDGDATIRLAHLRSGLGLWDYAARSVLGDQGRHRRRSTVRAVSSPTPATSRSGTSAAPSGIPL